MNILLLSQYFSTTKGGGEYVFSLLAKNLAKNNHKVWAITNKIVGENYEFPENVKIIFVSPTLEYKGGLPTGFIENLRYSINSFFKGLKLIKKEKIDLIHSNNFAPALSGSFLSNFTKIPHITTVHDVFSLCGDNYWKEWGKQSDISKINVLLSPLFEKLLIKLKHNAIHTVSEATKEDLIKFGAKTPIYVINNAIEIKNQDFKIITNPYQFVYVGRLVFYKNLEVIIKAVKIVSENYPKIKLILVGSGPHKKNLENLVRELKLLDNIQFSGFVSSSEKKIFLAKSLALLFPSLCEGFGLVILEAFEQNKPVVVSDIKPLSDIVTHNKTGYVVKPLDEKEWAKAITKIIENPVQSKNMGYQGRKLLEQQYNLEKMVEKVINMYRNFVNQ